MCFQSTAVHCMRSLSAWSLHPLEPAVTLLFCLQTCCPIGQTCKGGTCCAPSQVCGGVRFDV